MVDNTLSRRSLLSRFQRFRHTKARHGRDWREFLIPRSIILRRRRRRPILRRRNGRFCTEVGTGSFFVMHTVFPAVCFTIFIHHRQCSAWNSGDPIRGGAAHCSQSPVTRRIFRWPVSPRLIPRKFSFVDDLFCGRPRELPVDGKRPIALLARLGLALSFLDRFRKVGDEIDEAVSVAFWWYWRYLRLVVR